jgi:hypothetical protein
MKFCFLLLTVINLQIISLAQTNPGRSLENIFPVLEGTVIYSDTIWTNKTDLNEIFEEFHHSEFFNHSTSEDIKNGIAKLSFAGTLGNSNCFSPTMFEGKLEIVKGGFRYTFSGIRLVDLDIGAFEFTIENYAKDLSDSRIERMEMIDSEIRSRLKRIKDAFENK